MKVLLITHYDNLYGANNSLLKIVIKLKENGDTPIVVTNTEGALSEKLDELGVEYFICGVTQWQAIYTTPLRFWVKKIQRKPRIEKEVNMLYEHFKNEKIDVIHSNSSVLVHGAMLSKKLACKHIWHIREFSKEHFNMRYFYSEKEVKDYFCSSNVIVTISDALKKNYENKYPDANVVRIYNGVTNRDTDTHREVNEKKLVDETDNNRKVKLVCVGYLFKMKHQLELIKACKKLYSAGIHNFEMHFVGDGKNDYKSLLESELSNYDGMNIFLDGYMKNVNEYLNQMDIGVIASEYEGFGLVTVEYMLAGLPVIGRNSGGTPEIIVNEETGYVYDSEDELIEAMKKLITNANLRKQMGKNGFDRAIKDFPEENYTQSVLELYKSVCIE